MVLLMVHSAYHPALFFLHLCKNLFPFASTLELALEKIHTNAGGRDEYRTTSLRVNFGERALLMHPNNPAAVPGGTAFAGLQAKGFLPRSTQPDWALRPSPRAVPTPASPPASAPRGGDRLRGGIINN